MFSPTEKQVLKIIGRKKMTVTEITEQLYRDRRAPLAASITVGSAVRRINRKCEYHNLKWYLNSFGLGRAGKTVWKDKKD